MKKRDLHWLVYALNSLAIIIINFESGFHNNKPINSKVVLHTKVKLPLHYLLIIDIIDLF
jgi:hypothetical protein